MAETIVAVSIGLFFAILPISLGGWGVRELAIAQGFVLFGTPFPHAVAVSVLFGMIAGLVALPGVIVLFLPKRPVG